MIDHAIRNRCISSTDVGPIFGVDDYRDAFEVWTTKHGYAPPFDPTPRMLLGKDLEQGIMKAYSRITGREVQWFDRTVRHKARQWMAASPDAFVAGTPLERGVDSKLVFWDQRRKWGATARDIPPAIQLQAWWMMAVTECEVWDVAALVGEDVPRVYEIERDREAERVVIAKCEEWHRRYVVGDEVPPMSGSRAAAAWLQQAFPHHKQPDMRDATEEEIELLERYAAMRLVRDGAVAQCDTMQHEIQLAIADREGIQWPGGKFTWRRTQDGVEIDWESMARGLLNEKDKELRETLTGIYTRPKPGQRRMRFVSYVRDVSDAA